MIALTERQKRVYDVLAEVTQGGTIDYIGRVKVPGVAPSWANRTLAQLDHAGVVQIVPKGGPRRFRLLVAPDQIRVASAVEVNKERQDISRSQKDHPVDTGDFMRAVAALDLQKPEDVHTQCLGRYTGMRPDARVL